MVEDTKEVKPVTISEVKNILKKVEKDRKELLYEQKIAYEHANKFARLSVKDIKDVINELKKLEFLKEIQVYKIADILPLNEEDIKAIFAKERINLSDKEIKQILDIIKKYCNE